jgi:outer membrane biosynthesis protein TonB
MKLCGLLTALAVLLAVQSVPAQNALPEVTSHQNPIYPPLARQARLGGPVHLKITTDGHAVSSVTAIDGHPLLIKAATDNAQTWRFAEHVPGTFDVTFNFTSLRNRTTFLQEPGVVDIAVLPLQYNENSDERLDYTSPVTWDLELKTATDDIKTRLTMWTYGPWLRGYTAGPQNQERGLGNAHLDGDMFGFDAALDDSRGQRLWFSLIGKKVGDRIQGIFLDAWGASGTWTAIPSKPSSPSCSAASAAALENVIPIPEINQRRQPGYPLIPWEAHIQGQVRMRVSTDTSCVAKITTESSDPFLAQAAKANVRTWRFDFHKPGTFNVTFNYRLLEPGVSFLEEPGVVDILDLPPSLGGPRSGLWNSGSGQPEIWKAQLAGSRGRIQATFQFSFGCCQVGDVIDAKGRKEEINQGHSTGDIIGFSTIVRTANNRPIRVSLIGRMSGDRMQGVFLDDSGTPGTWTARLEPPPPAVVAPIPTYTAWKAHFRLVNTSFGKESALLDKARNLE